MDDNNPIVPEEEAADMAAPIEDVVEGEEEEAEEEVEGEDAPETEAEETPEM
jgi:hypothetical protein